MAKSAEAFRTISEVSELLDTPAHVLRFWESRFSQVRPVKRAGGRRYYRPNDVALLAGIKKLLHADGLTIRGVQKILKEQGIRHVAGLSEVDLTGGGTGVEDDTAPAPEVWPETASPDTAEPGDRLLPDPEDQIEAPMQVDAPTLPLGEADNVLTLGTQETGPAEKPTPPAAGARATSQPAASMLRAMDALRAEEKKSELTSVYLRLVRLKDRIARDASTQRG